MRTKPVKTMSRERGERENISRFPNFAASGNISGMRKLYYGYNALLIRCGNYIYNVSSEPELYNNL